VQLFDVGALGGANFALGLTQFNTCRRAEPVCPAFWGGRCRGASFGCAKRAPAQTGEPDAVCSVTTDIISRFSPVQEFAPEEPKAIRSRAILSPLRTIIA
jgi:hypothetical protein